MILSNSRYVDGLVVPQPDGTVAVRREFREPSGDYVLYTWKQSDRLDRIASTFLGEPRFWWVIMDLNPIIQNPYDINPGEQIRIPKRD